MLNIFRRSIMMISEPTLIVSTEIEFVHVKPLYDQINDKMNQDRFLH